MVEEYYSVAKFHLKNMYETGYIRNVFIIKYIENLCNKNKS